MKYLYLFVLSGILYGSLLPFDFQSMAFTRALLEFDRGTKVVLSWSGVSEIVVNFLLYVPLGSSVSLRARTIHSSTPGFLWAFAIALLLSAGVEIGQCFLPSRTASGIDILANTAGAIFGAGFFELLIQWSRSVMLFVARSNTGSTQDWLGELARSAVWLVPVYTLLLMLFCVPLPLQYSSLLKGSASFFVVPFVDFQGLHYSSVLLNGFMKILFFAPIGFVLGLAIHLRKVPRRARQRLWLQWILLVGLLAVGIEFLQLGTSSKTGSLSDSAFYMFGFFLGVFLFAALRRQSILVQREARLTLGV